MSKINIRESLRNMDADSCCKYDLLTMYDACSLTDEDKADIAKLLFDNEDPEVIYQKLCNYFCDDDVSELTGLSDVQNVTPFEAIIDNVKTGLDQKYDGVFYNDVAGQFEITSKDTTYTFGLSPVEYETDGISLYVDYNYDMPINYTSIKEASEDILNKCNEKVLMASQSNAVLDDDTMEYTVYDVVEDEGRLCAKCMNESTNSFEDIKLGKVNSDAVNELLNNILNNPNYKLTNDCRKKIADNSAPWGIVMSPSFDITASNALMSTGDFGGSVSFGESEELTFEKGDRVTDGNRKGTVIDCDSIKVLVDWDYSDTDDIEWVMKEDLSFVNALKESAKEDLRDGNLTEQDLLDAGYKYVASNSPYNLYRKIISGKGDWYAVNYENNTVQHITYAQARGDEPIDDKTGIKKLSMELGKKLLLQNESVDDGWVKRWSFADKWYKGPFVISKNPEPYKGYHLEKVKPNGATAKHYGNFNSIDDAKAEVSKYLKESADDDVNSNRFLPNMEYCPECGGTRFNVKTGVCLDCGYNEGYWGYTGTDDFEEGWCEDTMEIANQSFNNNCNNSDHLIESYVSGRYVWFNYDDIKDVRPTTKQIIDAYNIRYPNYSDPLVDIQQVDFNHRNYNEKELHYLVTDNQGNKFWAIVGNVPQDKLRQVLESHKDDIGLDEDFDVDDIVTSEQEFSSAATSINSNKLPAIYKMVNFRSGDVVVDFGGGKFDNAVNYLKDKGVTLLVYDPYNRSAEHNKEVLRILKEHGGADAAVNSNVLNVIKEPEAREAVLKNIKKITKRGAPIYITVYEGRGDGAEGPTKSGYQLNRKTGDYMDEVGSVFSNVKRKGKLITAINESTKHIKSSRNETFQDDKRLSSTSTNVLETQMIDDLEYFYEVYPEAMEPILIRNGATPDKDNWLDGCNIPQAYNEAVAYFESKYDNDDEYSELDTGVGSRLGWSNYIRSGIYEELDSDDYVDDRRELASKSTEGYVYTYCDECGKKNRVKVTFNNFNEPFNDTEYKCKYCGANNLLTDPHSYDKNGNLVEASDDGGKVHTKSGYQLNRKTGDYMTESIVTYASNIGQGYTAPNMVSLVEKAKELEKWVKEYKNSKDKDAFERLLPSFEDNILDYKSEIEEKIKDFDKYWEVHKKAMLDNISEAVSILKNIGVPSLDSKLSKLNESYSDDEWIDRMWEAFQGISGIMDISEGKKPNTYIVTFDSEGSATARARILLKALIKADLDIELDSTNGSNVFTFTTPTNEWEFIKGKMIKDSDGFLTSYDWYRNTDSGLNIFMFGEDEADPDYADWETDSYSEAEDWFNSYNGFNDEEELDESVKSSATVEVISKELKDAAYKLFKTPEWGFESDKEIEDYINPIFDVSEDPKTGDIEVQVRAELEYDNLMDLSDVLDKVVSKYDKDAYFDPEQPGILCAFIREEE